MSEQRLSQYKRFTLYVSCSDLLFNGLNLEPVFVFHFYVVLEECKGDMAEWEQYQKAEPI